LLLPVLLSSAACSRPAPRAFAPPALSTPELTPALQPQVIEDGHTRPRALAVGRRDGLLYVAATTANAVYIVDPDQALVRAVVPVGRFPDALLALEDGRVAVVPRYAPEVGLLEPGTHALKTVAAGPEAAHRGLAHDPATHTFYLASPATGSIKVYREDAGGGWRLLQQQPAGLSPRVVRLAAGRLLATDFLGHTLTAWGLERDGRVGAQLAQARFHAPPTDFVLAGGRALYVLTHEDRDVDRRDFTVYYLDSVLCELDPDTLARRGDSNLTELDGARLTAKLDGAAYDPVSGWLAVSGGASDDVLWFRPGLEPATAARWARVGANPQGVVFDARGRIWVADRLADALTRIDPKTGATRHLTLGSRPERTTPAEWGEVLFHSRDLTPRNVADGPRSVYACTACHEDGTVDGRLHPAKRNRFRSMTKTDRGIATTPPYLSIADIATLTEFADNIIASHAQGWEHDPSYDRYPVSVRVSLEATRTLDPVATRRALAAYMATLPNEPNPFAVPAGGFSEAAQRGARLFVARACTRCHQAVGNVALGNRIPRGRLLEYALRGQVAFAGPGLYDVGTPVLGAGGNNPPSLRGLWSTPPYFSDGSARTIAAVIERTDPDARKVHAPQHRSGFSEAERHDLAAFLTSL